MPAQHWYLSIELRGVTSQKSHCHENFNVRNTLKNQNLITIKTATKLNLPRLDKVCPVREAVTHIKREREKVTFSLK